MLILGYPITLALLPIYPTDDLLRHVVSYAWGYSHREMFPLASLPDYNLYPAFDLLAGAIAKTAGPLAAVKIISVACAAFIAATVFLVSLHWSARFGARKIDALFIALALLAAQLIERSFLARPEVWLFGWALWATTLEPDRRLRTAALVAGAILCSLSYWLAPVMFLFIFLADICWRKKMAIWLSLVAVHMVFWYVWSSGDIASWPRMMAQWTADRPFDVREVASSMQLALRVDSWILWGLLCLGFVAVFASTSGAIWSRLSQREYRNAMVAAGLHALYLGTNMMRYGPAAFAAGLPIMVRGLAWVRLPQSMLVVVCCLIAGSHSTALFSRLVSEGPPPMFLLPPGSRVLTGFTAATFSTTAANPGTVQVLPAMEVGASDPRVRGMAATISLGKDPALDCASMKDIGITHVIDRKLSKVPACLHPIGAQGAWRLWQVMPAPAGLLQRWPGGDAA